MGDALVICLLGAVVIGIVHSRRKNGKKGCHSCQGCAMEGSCHKK